MTGDDDQMPAGFNPAYSDTGDGITYTDADTTGAHSPEAMRILMEQGVDAYQAFLAQP